MARRKESPQKAAMREMMRDYLKNNDISIKDLNDPPKMVHRSTEMEGIRSLDSYP